jgi:predicted site-specific integrase-resolvase
MNDNRKQFWLMIEQNPSIIIVENKDRLTRFGFEYIKRLLTGRCEIIVMNNENNDETDLIKDLVSIITSFCCRLYGLRRGYNKAKKIQQEIQKDD